MIGDRALVILPTYNERENIADLLTAILRYAPGVHVLVVDDGSPDGTARYVAERGLRDERVRLLDRGAKLGLGTAYLAGFRIARSEGYSFAVTMDADFSHDPRHLPEVFMTADSGADIVVGSRYVPSGGVIGWGANRRLLSWCANRFVRTILQLRVQDCTGGYRCYSRRVLETLDFDAVVSHGYSALVELLWRCQSYGFRVVEVPIIFRDRERGASKISRSEIMRGITTVLRLAAVRGRPEPVPPYLGAVPRLAVPRSDP
jgi:glycosyltransferase involved in cell wall biosynthesis